MRVIQNLHKTLNNIHSKRQAAYYKKVRQQTRNTKMQLEKAKVIQKAKHERDEAKAELSALKPKKKFRMPQLVGSFDKLTKGMPSDAALHDFMFKSSLTPPSGTVRHNSPRKLSDDEIARQVLS